MILLAVATEIILPILRTFYGGLEEYHLLQELRFLFWTCFAFKLSVRHARIIRLILLYFVSSQFITVCVFIISYAGIDAYNISIYFEIIVFISAFLWITIKSYDRPSCAIDAKDVDRNKCYAIFREAGSVRIKDIIFSCFGTPTNSVCIYVDGFYKHNVRSDKYMHFQSINTDNKFAVELRVNTVEAKAIMSNCLNSKYSRLKMNCITTPRYLWECAGIKLNLLDRYLPPLLLRRIVRVYGRR